MDDITCSLASCNHVKTSTCFCTKEQKLPSLDLSYIRAQRLKVGKKCAYQMGFVEKRETRKQLGTMNRKEEEKISDENRNKKIRLAEEEERVQNQEANEFMNEIPDEAAIENNNDQEFRMKSVNDKLKLSLQNRNSFPTVASVSFKQNDCCNCHSSLD